MGTICYHATHACIWTYRIYIWCAGNAWLETKALIFLKNTVQYGDSRNVKCCLRNTGALGISIPVCKEKRPNGILEANSQRLLQEPVVKQFFTFPFVREEMKPWEAARIHSCNNLLDLTCPHFLLSRLCFAPRGQTSIRALSLQDMAIDHPCSNLVSRQF